jgi:hypothetical protein
MSDVIQITLNQLHPHPAQMRTQYDLDSLAGLALQLHQRGLDAWQPLLVSRKESGYQIVSGHRRQMALLLSLALGDWAAKQEAETEITIEVVRTMLATLVEQLGSLEKVITALRRQHGAQEITAVASRSSVKRATTRPSGRWIRRCAFCWPTGRASSTFWAMN